MGLYFAENGFPSSKMISLEEGRVLWPITPTFDYLPWQIVHNLYTYIQSLTTV